nr:hypothetical protein [Tanacetum cinerariifolium]
MVAILEKSDAAEGFEQINNFLSRSYINHALTVNPHVYISCIKQFWNIDVVKRSGDVIRLQALVDKKRIVITEETNDADLSKHTTRYISPALTQKVFANMRRVRKGFLGVETPLFEKEVATDVGPPTPTSPSSSSPIIPSSPPHQPPCPPQPQDAEGSSLLFQRVLDTCSALTLRVEDDVENVFNQGRIIVDMDQDEGIELVIDQEKDAKVEGRHADKQAEIYNIDLDHSSKVLSMQEDDTEV